MKLSRPQIVSMIMTGFCFVVLSWPFGGLLATVLGVLAIGVEYCYYKRNSN